MNITYLGHAGLQVATAHATVIVDPWLSPEGAYQGSWFQYPDNHHLVAPEFFVPTAVIISHEHLDHLDPWYLAQVPSHVPVIIPRYPSPVLRRKIQAGGPREVIEVLPWELVEIADGTYAFFVSEESLMNHDSAVVILGDGHNALNLNDARLSQSQLRRIRAHVGGIVDLFAFQGSGASWHPMCYEYPEEHSKRLSWQKRLTKFNYVARAIKAVEPTVAVPFAGPPCFLDPELFRHNGEMERGVFPDQEQVADWLAMQGITNTLVLLPGDTWDVSSHAKETDPTWSGFSLAGDRWSYLEAYSERQHTRIEEVIARYPIPNRSLWEPFRDYFENLLTLSPYFNQKIGMRVGFDIVGPGGGDWRVDFMPGQERVLRGRGDCEYRYKFDSRWLPPLLDGLVPWEDFFLSLRFKAWRNPDRYNEHLLGLLKFASAEALDAVEKYETSADSNERITIQTEDQKYLVERYCPHGGSDLADMSEILPGRILRCLAHGFEFDLDTGQCRNGVCPPLSARLC